jgi:hypothetical protein
MTHDSLCHLIKGDSWTSCSVCDLIAKVREETIAAAVQRVEAYEYISTIGVTLSSVVPKEAAIAAIKGDQERPPQLPPSVGIPEKKGSLR